MIAPSWDSLVFLYVYSVAERPGKHESLTLGSHNLRDRCAPILDDFPSATTKSDNSY